MKMVTGAMSTMMVTLSRKAERTAVARERTTSIRMGLPPASLAERTASHGKTPVFARMLTMIIMPARRKMTLRSMAAKACRWS